MLLVRYFLKNLGVLSTRDISLVQVLLSEIRPTDMKIKKNSHIFVVSVNVFMHITTASHLVFTDSILSLTYTFSLPQDMVFTSSLKSCIVFLLPFRT